MNTEHSVYLNNMPVGSVVLKKVGAYYSYQCICSLTGKEIYRIWLVNRNVQINLGVCAPMGNIYETHGKFPVKQLGEEPVFVALPIKNTCKSYIIEIEKPVLHLEDLENSKLIPSEKHTILYTYNESS